MCSSQIKQLSVYRRSKAGLLCYLYSLYVSVILMLGKCTNTEIMLSATYRWIGLILFCIDKDVLTAH